MFSNTLREMSAPRDYQLSRYQSLAQTSKFWEVNLILSGAVLSGMHMSLNSSCSCQASPELLVIKQLQGEIRNMPVPKVNKTHSSFIAEQEMYRVT